MNGRSVDRNKALRIVTGAAVLTMLAAMPAFLAVRVSAQTNTTAAIYKDKCAVCHGDDGAGKTARGRKLKVKDVRETVGKVTVEQMADIVSKGKAPDMDGFGKELTPEQVKQIVAYYRDLAQKK